MPLFRSKFQPKKSPPRKATNNSNRNLDAAQIEQEFGIQFDKVVLNLDDQLQFEFDNKGKWIQQNRSKSVTPTSQISRKLQSDNELLRIQVELLLNMVVLYRNLYLYIFY